MNSDEDTSPPAGSQARTRTRIEWDFQSPLSAPSHATEILLVRHGSTAGSGFRPAPTTGGGAQAQLNEVGIKQAELTAKALATEPIDRIFITPLTRTADTARPLAERLGAEVEVVDDLIEIHLGEWDGGEFRRRVKARDPLLGQMFREQRWSVIPGAEEPAVFAGRVMRGLEQVTEKTGPGGRAVVFTHGGVIAEACRQATDSAPFAFLQTENCSFTSLIASGGEQPVLHRFNVTNHLVNPAL